MAFASKYLAAIAFLALTPLGACATEEAGSYGAAAQAQGPTYQGQGYQGAAYGATGLTAPPRLTPPEAHDGLLSSPPNNARAGECYAKVVVPGQPIGAPPAQTRAVWVQTPPGPGQISPTWCIYYLPGAPQPVAMTPERYGWIRVVCDKDATEEKIRHVQRRLHAWGDYDGGFDGHYDGATAQGVVRFQEQRHIDHGGYLSVKTVEALDGAPPQPELVPAFDAGHPNPNPPMLAQPNYAPPAGAIYASPIYQAQAAQPPAIYSRPPSPCGPVGCASVPPSVIYAPPQVIYRQAPPQVVVQRVIQPIYVQQPIACAQPVCQSQAYACGGAACGTGGPGWGGGFGQQGQGPQGGQPPYRALLTWPGKTQY